MSSPDIEEHGVSQTEEKLAVAEETSRKLDILFENVFKEWEKSAGEVWVPERTVEEHGEVLFSDTVFDSQPKRITSLALQKGIEEGEIMIGVTIEQMTPIFRVNRVKSTKAPEGDPHRTVLALFSYNFFERCYETGVAPKRVVEGSLTHILYWDAKISADNTPRLKVKAPKENSFIRVIKPF